MPRVSEELLLWTFPKVSFNSPNSVFNAWVAEGWASCLARKDSDTVPMTEGGGGPGTRYHIESRHACMYARVNNYGKQMYILCALNEKLTISSCVTINHLQRQQTNITFCRDSAVFCCMAWRVAHGFQLSPLQAIINLRGCCT